MDLMKVSTQLEKAKSNLPEKIDEKELANLSRTYLDNTKLLKNIEEFVSNAKSYLLQVVDKFGTADGNHKVMSVDGITIKDQVALRKAPIATAGEYLENKGFKDVITVKNIINLKAGVDSSKIPKKILDSLDQYFDIKKEVSVDKDSIELLYKNSKITDEEYNSLLTVTKTHTLKVSE